MTNELYYITTYNPTTGKANTTEANRTEALEVVRKHWNMETPMAGCFLTTMKPDTVYADCEGIVQITKLVW